MFGRGPRALEARTAWDILRGVKTLIAIALALGLGLSAGSALADQSDPRLEGLFARLKLAANAEAAQGVEQSIWHIWIQSDDTAIRLLMAEGLEAMARRDLRAALGKFDQTVKIAPDFAEGWNKRATVHYLLGNYGESLHDIDKTLALEPRHFGALSGRGLVLLELERPDLALKSFESALEIHPRLPGANFNAEALRRQLKKDQI